MAHHCRPCCRCCVAAACVSVAAARTLQVDQKPDGDPTGVCSGSFQFPGKGPVVLVPPHPGFRQRCAGPGAGPRRGWRRVPPGASQDPRGGPTGSAEGKPGRSHGSLRGPREPGLGGNWLGPILRYQPSLGSSKPIRGWPGGSMTRVPCGYCRWVTVLQRRPFWITQPAQGSSPC